MYIEYHRYPFVNRYIPKHVCIFDTNLCKFVRLRSEKVESCQAERDEKEELLQGQLSLIHAKEERRVSVTHYKESCAREKAK